MWVQKGGIMTHISVKLVGLLLHVNDKSFAFWLLAKHSIIKPDWFWFILCWVIVINGPPWILNYEWDVGALGKVKAGKMSTICSITVCSS